MRVSAENAMKRADAAERSRPRRSKSSLASTTIERPSGVSSGSDESCAASASSRSLTPGTGRKRAAWRLPSVIVPVLSSSSTETSPAASTARPEVASTLRRTSRFMPAMPMAESSAPIVVGMSETKSAAQHGQRDARAGEMRHRHERRADDEEDQAHAGEQDRERDLVGRALALGALDERDHAVEERLAGVRGDADDDAVARARACRR